MVAGSEVAEGVGDKPEHEVEKDGEVEGEIHEAGSYAD